MADKKAVTAMDEVKSGAFIRTESTFRNWIKADGSTQYPPEAGRYHLYVSYACPWASRCLLLRALKGLEDVIGLSVVAAVMKKTRPDDPEDAHVGWWFDTEGTEAGTIPDPFGAPTIRDLYLKASKDVNKFTVPVLFDKKTMTIVSNESSEIIQMFGDEFNELATRNKEWKLRPSESVAEIDAVNQWVYPNINNGVYRCGFARSQEAYDEAVVGLFESLDKVEEILSKQRYLASDKYLTEADVRLFVTIVRFDEVYVGHFKCNKKQIEEYPNLSNYTRDIYQTSNVADTVNMVHIREHYHRSHKTINPFSILPIGPGVDFTTAHDRDRLGKPDPTITE